MPTPLMSSWAPVLSERPGMGLTTSSGAGAPVGKDRSVEALSRQFEQLLVRQMLSQMRSTSLSGDEQGGGPSAAYLQMADDHLAGIVASVGGLGLGHSVRRWMQGVQAYQDAAAQGGPITQTAPSLPSTENSPIAPSAPNAPALPKLPG
jgi:Rod binding domain-containing protein